MSFKSLKPVLAIGVIVFVFVIYIFCIASSGSDEHYIKFVPRPKPTLPMIDYPKGGRYDLCFWNKMCRSNFCNSAENICSVRLPERKPNGSECESRLDCQSNFCGVTIRKGHGELARSEILAIEEKEREPLMIFINPKCMDMPPNYKSPACVRNSISCFENLSYDGTYVTDPPEFPM